MNQKRKKKETEKRNLFIDIGSLYIDNHVASKICPLLTTRSMGLSIKLSTLGMWEDVLAPLKHMIA